MRSFVAAFAAKVMLLVRSSVALVLVLVPALYAAGWRMLKSFHYVRLEGHVRMGVPIFSYGDAITFGVADDCDTAPELDALCGGIERAMASVDG